MRRFTRILLAIKVDDKDDQLCDTLCDYIDYKDGVGWKCRGFDAWLDKPDGGMYPERCLDCVLNQVDY
jgi:hypothetical protein